MPFNPASLFGFQARNPFAIPRNNPFQYDPFGDDLSNPYAPKQPDNPAAQWFPKQKGDPSAAPPSDPSVDYVNEYNKLLGNRPNRLAYQQAVEAGQPQINRGKWAKLGAIIAGGATGFGQQNASAGAQLGISAYEEPQRRSDEKWKEKMSGLGSLATMEDQDVKNKMAALEAQRKDWFDTKDLGIKQSQLDIQRAAEDRATKTAQSESKMRDAQITNMAIDNMIPIKHADGTTWLYDKGTGKETFVARTEDTDEDALTKARNLFSMQEEIRGHYEKLHDQRMAGSAMDVAREGTDRAVKTANINADAKVDAVKARNEAVGKSLTPGQKAAQQYNDLSIAWNSDPDLRGLSIKDFVDITKGPGGGQIITPKPSWEIAGYDFGLGDSKKETEIKNKISAIVVKSLSGGGSPAPNTVVPNTAGKGGGAGTTSTGKRYTISPVFPKELGSF